MQATLDITIFLASLNMDTIGMSSYDWHDPKNVTVHCGYVLLWYVYPFWILLLWIHIKASNTNQLKWIDSHGNSTSKNNGKTKLSFFQSFSFIWYMKQSISIGLVGVKNEWSDVLASSRWFINASNRYSFPVQRINSNHAEMHSNEFNRVPFLFDTFFVRFFELVDLMKFFRLPFAWLFLPIDISLVCIFHLICIDWFDTEKSFYCFFPQHTNQTISSLLQSDR